jgi:PadR family transcriptional regulator AphA
MKDKPATEYAILGALMSERRHGYEILQFLETGLGPAWRISTSQLYALLKRLENEGMLDSRMETQDTRPSKRVFSLRPPGEKKFNLWLKNPSRHVRDLRIEFLAKLFFFHNLDIPGAQELVTEQTELLEQVKERLRKKKQSESDDYNRLVYGFRISTLEGWLNWLKSEAILFVK